MTIERDELPRPSLSATLETRIRGDIAEGAYPPGELLPPERELAAKYGVSRATIKQALVRLEQLGLIETRHGVGSRVCDPSGGPGADVLQWLVSLGEPKWIDDVFETRRLLGPIIARLAAERASKRDAERVRRALEAMESATNADEAHARENDVQKALAAAGGNRILMFLVSALVRAYAPARALLRVAFADWPSFASELSHVVRAVELGRPNEAERASERYFRTTEEPLRKALRRSSRR